MFERTDWELKAAFNLAFIFPKMLLGRLIELMNALTNNVDWMVFLFFFWSASVAMNVDDAYIASDTRQFSHGSSRWLI